jgi:hypothetical protein
MVRRATARSDRGLPDSHNANHDSGPVAELTGPPRDRLIAPTPLGRRDPEDEPADTTPIG